MLQALHSFLQTMMRYFCSPFSTGSGDGRGEFFVILAAFAMLGFHVGVWAVLLADLASALNLSPGAVGFALTLMAGAGILGLLVAGRLADRVGRRQVLVSGIGGTGAFFLLLTLAGDRTTLLAILLFGGVGAGFYDVAANSLGGDHEREYGSRVMTLFHAGFSGGAALGALGSGATLAAGAGFEAVYSVAGMMLLLFALVALRLPLPDRMPGSENTGSLPAEPRNLLLPVAGIVFPVLLVGLSFLTDAALEGFAAIYLRGTLVAGPLLAGLGIGSFHLAAMLGRLSSAAALRRLGERRVLVLAGVSAAVGMALVLATGSALVAAGGLLLVGAALSPVAPIAFSLAARANPARSGRDISVVTAFGYLAFLVSPLLVGGLADLYSLRASLLLLVVFCSGIALAAWLMPEPDKPGR